MYIFRKIPEQIILDIVSATFSNDQLISATDSEDIVYQASEIELITSDDQLSIPGFDYPLVVGDVVRLSYSDKRPWTVRKGWYSSEGTPAVWGWYLESIPAGECRPFRQKDRMEVLLIEKNNPYVSSLEG